VNKLSWGRFLDWLLCCRGSRLQSIAFPTSPLASVPAGRPLTPAAEAEYVARLGDCVACHSVPDGKPFAGGLKMGTPLGVIYATNITPDKETGIGNYTLPEFDNAVRRGGNERRTAPLSCDALSVLRQDVGYGCEGPLRLLHAQRSAGSSAEPERRTEMAVQPALAAAFWNAVFLDNQPYRVKPAFDVAWNRGAYLVQGLGHCGSCHTPRGLAMQEKAAR